MIIEWKMLSIPNILIQHFSQQLKFTINFAHWGNFA